MDAEKSRALYQCDRVEARANRQPANSRVRCFPTSYRVPGLRYPYDFEAIIERCKWRVVGRVVRVAL